MLKADCLRRHPLQISDFRYKTRCRCGWWCRSICWWEAIMHEGFPFGRPSEIGKPRDIRCCPALHPVCCSGLIGVTPWSLEIPTPCAHRVGNAWEDWRSRDKSDSQWKISDARYQTGSRVSEKYQKDIRCQNSAIYTILLSPMSAQSLEQFCQHCWVSTSHKMQNIATSSSSAVN